MSKTSTLVLYLLEMIVIKASHKSAVSDGFASATFLNTKQAHTWSAFTLGSWFPQRISFSIRKWMASAVHAGINSAIMKD